MDPFAASAIPLLILTGARLREILDAQWRHVDISRGLIFLPDSKSGAKPIHLNAAALDVLSKIPRLEGSPNIILARTLACLSLESPAPWAAVTRAANLECLRVHDLRHSYASIGAGSSLGPPIIGKLLGHAKAGTTSRYAHLDADPVRRAAETIGVAISAAMGDVSGGGLGAAR
jgi:integrase